MLSMAVGGTIATAEDAAEKASPELIVDVDVNDEVWLRADKMTEADVIDLVAKLKQNGCQTLIVRCGCLGILPYRTELSYPASFDAEHARANPAPAIVKDTDAYIVQRREWMKRYAEVIGEFNPPAAYIRACHKQGIKLIAWIDLFDDGFPGYRSKFLDEHPLPVGRQNQPYCKGKTRLFLFSEWLPGSPSQLEARLNFWADTTRKYGFDGIDVHEAWNFQNNPAHMPLLGAMAERLRGKTQSP